MKVYSFYYGANSEQGIGVKAQSPELERLPLASELKELASFHALESSEHSGEMLSFLLEREKYSILGVSYIESPKSSGYNRSAPCSIQYVASMQDLDGSAPELSKLINFVNFQKPSSSTPASLNHWPMNKSGYFYHNSPTLLAPLVDGITRVALSDKKETLLIGLPKGKNSEYAFARYTVAELMAYLPTALRSNIHFFTGLPVAETGDAVTGFDNAVKYGANVIFCPNEYYQKLTSSRVCIGVDMEAPGKNYGAFADYISQVPDVSDGLTTVDSLLGGRVTYDSLNKAGQQAKEGKVITMDSLRREIAQRDKQIIDFEKEIREYNKQIDNGNEAYHQLKQEFDKLQTRVSNQAAWAPEQQVVRARRTYQDDSEGNKSSILKWILIGLAGVILLVGGFFLGREVFPKENKTDSVTKQEQSTELKEEQAEIQTEQSSTNVEKDVSDEKKKEDDNNQFASDDNQKEDTKDDQIMTYDNQKDKDDGMGELPVIIDRTRDQENNEQTIINGENEKQETEKQPEVNGKESEQNPDNLTVPKDEKEDSHTDDQSLTNVEKENQETDNQSEIVDTLDNQKAAEEKDELDENYSDDELQKEQEKEKLEKEYPLLFKLINSKEMDFQLNNSYRAEGINTKELIVELQKRLKELGYDLGTSGSNKDGVDGDYGSKTREAVREFQRQYGFKQYTYADRKTVEKLLSPDTVPVNSVSEPKDV